MLGGRLPCGFCPSVEVAYSRCPNMSKPGPDLKYKFRFGNCNFSWYSGTVYVTDMEFDVGLRFDGL